MKKRKPENDSLKKKVPYKPKSDDESSNEMN